MKRMKYLLLLALLIIAGGCGGPGDSVNRQTEPDIEQQADGKVILDLRKAYLLQDSLHPDMNTAEWSFSIKSKGRYELWLSSFTKDTMDLKYESPVIIYFQDKRIQARPVGNQIIADDGGSSREYFRADSKLGSVYIDNPGNYNIQVVSDKVRPYETGLTSMGSRHTELRSLILKPMTR